MIRQILQKPLNIAKALKNTTAYIYDDQRINRRVQALRSPAKVREDIGKYHLIFRESASSGFFSNLYVFYPEIKSSIERGKIPVIDTLNFFNQSLPGREGMVNIWEEIYEQPLNKSLEHAFKAKMLSHSHGCRRYNSNRLPWDMEWSLHKESLQKEKQTFNSLIRLRPSIENHIKQAKSIFKSYVNSIGVTLRGTCYTSKKPYGHPIQPSLESILRYCEKSLASGICDSIYLASIDEEIYSAFSNSFGEKLLFYPRPLYSSSTHDLFREIDFQEDPVKHCLDYVTSIYLFRYCSHVIGGISSSTIFIPLIVDESVSCHFPFLGYYS